MALQLYNTLTRKKEIFKPLKDNEVRMYVCGPTVNDAPHLGHARQQIAFDILRRYLKFFGYKVKFVSNVTDIEDKIINKARESHEEIKELTERNYKLHMGAYASIGVEKPDIQPRATEFIQEMISLVLRLEKKGCTYNIAGDGIYFDISKFKDYGKLSHQKKENLIAGKRVKVRGGKRNPEDFVLWKFSKGNEPSWDFKLGRGRPGWHLECSAMSAALLGLPFDIHGGGQDLIFPHHEDEIAQSEAAFGKKVANFWVHNGMVNVDKIKMSKSLGNFKTINDLLGRYRGEVIRYFVISTHYGKPIDFSKTRLKNAKNSYDRLKNIVGGLENDNKINDFYIAEFKKALNDDLDTPKALQVIWKIVRDGGAEGKIRTIQQIDSVFNLGLLQRAESKIPQEILNLAREREDARKNKQWQRADELREKIRKKGWQIDDSDKGPIIKKEAQ